VISSALQAEPWKLNLLYPTQRLHQAAAIYWLALLASLTILILASRIYRQQQQLSRTRAQLADELEQQVEIKTAELKKAQQALISNANFAMLGRMSAAINHEINQPLASMRLNLASLRAMLQQAPSSNREVSDTVVDIDRTTKRISRVIETLRNLSRESHGDSRTLRTTDIIAELITTLQRERPVLSRCLQSGPLCDATLHGNPVLIQQALLNLVYNAFDAVAANDQPIVTIEADSDASTVTFSVSDNGAGVDPEIAALLFEPFTSTRTKPGGMGLGLTLALQIARDHGGDLIYHPAEPNGSRFTLCLPGARS